MLHCDFNPDAITRLREKVRKEALRMVVPWTLLVTFKPGAKMYFKVGGSMIIAVLKRPGDAVLFRGDVRHGGGCYKVEHWRFHFYWEPKDTIQAAARLSHLSALCRSYRRSSAGKAEEGFQTHS